DVDLRGKPDDRNAGAGTDHIDLVVAAGADDRHLVGRAVAAAARRRQVDRHLLDVGVGEIVDGDPVGAAQGVELDLLDIVEVHDDVGDVAGEPGARAI